MRTLLGYIKSNLNESTLRKLQSQVFQQEVQLHITTFQHILLLQKQISGLQDQLKLKIPYLDGWKTSFGKKQESREWVTIVTIERIQGVIGVTYDRCINHHLWYKQNNSFVWIFGGFKCCKGAEKYGLKAQNENFTGKVILNNKGELSFQYYDTLMGVAIEIPEDIRKQGLYLIVSFINQGKIRLTMIAQEQMNIAIPLIQIGIILSSIHCYYYLNKLIVQENNYIYSVFINKYMQVIHLFRMQILNFTCQLLFQTQIIRVFSLIIYDSDLKFFDKLLICITSITLIFVSYAKQEIDIYF